MARRGSFAPKRTSPSARPPGKSEMAPGHRMKMLGLPNASTIAPGRVRIGAQPKPVTKPPMRPSR